MKPELNKDEALAVIREALEILGEKYQGEYAERMLLAIGYQESGFKHRKQINGPAKGFWQFERAGGVLGVMTHTSTKKDAAKVIQMLWNAWAVDDVYAVYNALEKDDIMAACFARLLLYSHPEPLPTNENDAWRYYIDTWRPGKPHRDRWTDNWKKSQINNTQHMETQLYVVFHQEDLPPGYDYGCTETADEWSKTFVYLNDEQKAEFDDFGLETAFVGKRPGGRSN